MKSFYSLSVLFGLILSILSTDSMATTYTVVNTDDAGPGSFRQAIIDAAPGDTVDFDLTMLISGNDTIKLTSEININKALVIEGYYTSYDTLFISGEGVNRVLNVSAGSGTVTLRGLTLINGNTLDGGGIYKSGGAELHVYDCNIMNCTATDQGGGIHKASGYMYVHGTHITGCHASNQGGGIYLSPSGLTDFEYCTINSNSCDGDGGGLHGFVAHSNYRWCTFTDNVSLGQGGGIYNWGSSVLMTVLNCTFTNNSSPSSGGIDFWGSSIVFTFGGSVVTGNTGSTQLDIWGAGASTTSLGYNVVGDATMMGSVASDQLSISAAAVNLEPLGDYGGTTFTMKPSTPSSAIDMGDPSDFSDAQNGAITDGNRDAGAAEDYSCPVKYSSFYAGTCGDYTVPSGDETYSGPDPLVVNDTIMNSCGTDSIMTIIVVFTDLEAPVPDMATLSDTTAECEVTPDAPTATDACEGAIVGTTTTPFPITSSMTITWTYDDGNGNISTQDQDIIIIPIDTSVSVSGITLTSNSSGSTYQWVDCNNSMSPISGATDIDFTPTSNGSYAVIVTNGSCTDTSACYDITQIGIEENKLNTSIYPNPSDAIFNLNLVQWKGVTLSVYSTDGKLIYKDENLSGPNYQLDLGDVQSGVYILKLNGEGLNETVKRLVKQ